MMASQRKINFSPGPAAIPLAVLEKTQASLLNYKGTGVSVLEMSHRSKDFSAIIQKAESDLRTVLSIPDNYKVVFLQGGGTGQFAAVALNLINLKPQRKADYIVTGSWSEKAYKEAQKYGKINLVFPKPEKYNVIPDRSTWSLDPEASYVYYCENETVHGVEFLGVPDLPEGTILVGDLSSNFVSRPVDVSKYGLIYAGAQKNCGPAGVCMVIVREDLIGQAIPECPVILDYAVNAKNGSLYNTPPTFSIYMVGLVLEWILDQGGIQEIQRRSAEKSTIIYDTISNSNGFYNCVVDSHCRSRMNVCLRIASPGGDEALESKFIEEAAKRNIIQVKGHRSVGGLRFSLYNAVTVEDTQTLADLMTDFQKQHA